MTAEGGGPRPARFERLIHEHRRLDDLFGRFLAAAGAGETSAARDAILEFDREVRRHTEEEEREIYPSPPPGEKLVPRPDEGVRERLARQMRLEHVQVRELSGMIDRLLAKGDLESARSLAASLARRWDAHTSREEEEVFTSGA